MPDYSKGKIYKIVDLSTNECYIGSTVQKTLASRLAQHVRDYKAFEDGRGHFISSFKVLEGGNYDIQLIENFPCKNKDELHSREGFFIKSLECVNNRVAGRTLSQYYADNAERIKERCMQYYKDNKEIVSKRQSLYREQKKDHFKEYNINYCLQNAERLKERSKQYRLENAEKIKEHKNRVVECACGKSYTYSNESRHVKSKYHQAFISNKSD
jgi:hypothetical protein